MINSHSIYRTDIKPKGFKVIEMDGYITEKVVKETKEIINNPKLNKEMVVHNYELGKRYYSYSVLEQKLKNLLLDCFGE